MRRPQSLTLPTEAIALAVSIFFALCSNRLLWSAILAGRDPASTHTWLMGATVLAMLVALNFLVIAPFLTRRSAKPLLGVLLVATAVATYFMDRYKVYLDPGMLRNVLATDPREAGDLLAWSLLPHLLLFAGLPIWLLARVRIGKRPLRRALAFRIGTLGLAALVFAVAAILNYQELAALMRNNKELRYLATPGNYLYSLGRATVGTARANLSERAPLGGDVARGGSWEKRDKPVVLVMVLGETARSANWGLSGYTRQTTPELAAASDLVNFASVTSCGTNTETSVPCIFSPWGRREYDEARIRGSESLLDVVARAGFRVVWVDNQSGCKGVCAGVEVVRPDPVTHPALCHDGECLDGVLAESLQKIVAETPGNLLVVLHQMGNHGPAYFKRYPADAAAWGPACATSDLAHCSRDEIVNAYDNALRYTDRVLADTLAFLRGLKTHDAAFLYVSDHGESLGENGLYLHGIPYAIAPENQTRVPMAAWFSPGFTRATGLDLACIGRQSAVPASHDNIFHSLLGLLDLKTSVYAAELDFSAGCRPA